MTRVVVLAVILLCVTSCAPVPHHFNPGAVLDPSQITDRRVP